MKNLKQKLELPMITPSNQKLQKHLVVAQPKIKIVEVQQKFNLWAVEEVQEVQPKTKIWAEGVQPKIKVWVEEVQPRTKIQAGEVQPKIKISTGDPHRHSNDTYADKKGLINPPKFQFLSRLTELKIVSNWFHFFVLLRASVLLCSKMGNKDEKLAPHMTRKFVLRHTARWGN